jgi:hypothetical protein
MRRTVVLAVLAVALVTGGAARCHGNGNCNPGDTRPGRGHTEVCKDDRKWHVAR